MRQKKPKRSVVADLLILGAIIFVVVALVQLCESNALSPYERDCLDELRASTRKDANYTQDEVVRYGRCVETQGGK
jgi:hypothetical protein